MAKVNTVVVPGTMAEHIPAIAKEAACLGAALLAGVGAGVYADAQTAVASAVAWQARVEPDAESAAAYEQRYALYRQLYPLLADTLHAL